MPKSLAILIVRFLLIAAFLGPIAFVAIRRTYQDRRRILADGTWAQAQVTQIGAPGKDGACMVRFRFQPTAAGRPVGGSQRATQAAIAATHLAEGSAIQVSYLPRWPRWAFIEGLAAADRLTTLAPAAPGSTMPPPRVRWVSFAPENAYRWHGGGDVVLMGDRLLFTARRRRPFWFAKTEQREVPSDAITDVEQLDATVRLTMLSPGEPPRPLQITMVDAAQARELAESVPTARSARFVPVLAEKSAFDRALTEATPKAPVTPTLVAINGLIFLLSVALGGGFIGANPQVMIELGSNYTPLTLGGQWWRLLTSIFLHFGLFHLALNMWVLYVNGGVAERIFGRARYLVIYLVSGLGGSVVSLLWHPLVNGAGASGAIFGIIGALIAFFVSRKGGVPASVMKAQRNSMLVFVLYNLLYGARFRSIDNAAHLGGLATGLVLGLILARPLTAARNDRRWAMQWASACGVCLSLGWLIAHGIATGSLAPRAARDQFGRPIPLAALLPPIRSLGGFQLGETQAQVLRAKGQPISRSADRWVYNAIDSRHDGVYTLSWRSSGPGGPSRVGVIDFTGKDPESAPPELPRFSAVSASSLIRDYGEPVKTEARAQGWQGLLFRNGVYASMFNGKVYSYGIVDLPGHR